MPDDPLPGPDPNLPPVPPVAPGWPAARDAPSVVEPSRFDWGSHTSSAPAPPPAPAPLSWPAPPDAPTAASPAVSACPPESGTAPPLPPGSYPMHFEVAYPERLTRLSTFFRGLLILPVFLFLYFVGPIVNAAFAAGWVTVFLRRKYPAWLFAAAAGGLGFFARTAAYGLLLTGRYPSFDPETSPVVLEYDEPPSGLLSRWRLFFWKGALLIPHVVVLWFLGIAVFVVTILAWFSVLFTGRYPRGLFAFVTGVLRWHLRVAGYFASFNDRFPPFALSAAAGPASKATTVISGVIGGLAGAGFAALIVVVAIAATEPKTVDVDYALLEQGRDRQTATFDDLGDRYFVTLVRAHDPAGNLAAGLRPATGERIVTFEWSILNSGGSTVTINAGDAWLFFVEGDSERRVNPGSVLIAGERAPETIRGGTEATVYAVFVLPADAEISRLRFRSAVTAAGGLEYRFR